MVVLTPVYAGTPQLVLRYMMRLAKPRCGERLVDVGSGKGKIVIGAAERYPGLKCIGYEIDPDRVEESRRRIATKGLEDRIEIIGGDVFDYSLEEADIVTTFLSSKGMELLEPKVLDELKESARVVSHDYDFPNLEPNKLRCLVDLSDFFPWSPVVISLQWVELYEMNNLLRKRSLKEFLQFWKEQPRFPLSDYRL
jgi:ubiquinone/menaquinone biosynthesis C-methylase UbiE